MSNSENKIKNSLIKAFISSLSITVIAVLFLYFTKMELSVKLEAFAVVLFLVMFVYKFIWNYYLKEKLKK